MQTLVNEALSKDSPFVSNSKLLELLAKKQYEQLENPSNYIDMQKLKSSLQQKQELLSKFMSEYKQLPCDVVSITLAKDAIENAPYLDKAKSSSVFAQDAEHDKLVNVLDKTNRTPFIHVLEFVNESLATVANEHRREMKLGEYLARHPLIGHEEQLSDYANRIIREKIESVLGQ